MANPNSTLNRFMLIVMILTAVGAAPTVAQEKAKPPAVDLAALAGRFAKFADDLPPVGKLGIQKILAYEENKYFVYVRGAVAAGQRRIVFCKPGTFVIDDDSDTAAVKASGQTVKTVCKEKVAGRFIQVINVIKKDSPAPKANIAAKDGAASVTLTAAESKFTLRLPTDVKTPGTIAVAQGGKDVLPERQFPVGIMPHGAKGVKLLERWDSSYRRTRMPGWDVGRPATELKKVIEGGTIKPGKALVLGCGTGTNAVYLAQKGFDVTAVDVAPTAIKLCAQRARKAKVKVRWLVADVLALGDIGQFDFVFDRGCYHHVRRIDAKGFVNSVNSVTKTGSRVLILAGNANEPRHGGPPRVDEPELVGDFAGTWDFVRLAEMKFEGRDPNRKSGPWAWSMLLRRRAPKK